MGSLFFDSIIVFSGQDPVEFLFPVWMSQLRSTFLNHSGRTSVKKLRFQFTTSFALGVALIFYACSANIVSADVVSFQVDPTAFDANMDGNITDDEFNPVGDGGTIFSLTPTDNLVGADRLFLDPSTGLQYGGGGGSSLSFDFMVNENISLESYTLSSSGFFLGDPIFNISQGATVLSSMNTSIASGETHSFNGGPLLLTAGTNYSFETQVSGAAIQSFVSSWTYSTTSVPEPGSAGLLAVAGLAVGMRRRR
jgi:hypothetical protein